MALKMEGEEAVGSAWDCGDLVLMGTAVQMGDLGVLRVRTTLAATVGKFGRNSSVFRCFDLRRWWQSEM